MPESPAITNTCPVCGSIKLEVFFEVSHAPVHCGLLWQDRQAALDAPVGDISLALCLECSHVFNQRFDPDLMKYDQPYDNSLFFSPRFQEYARNQADRVIETYDIHKKNIIEVGSGKGDFLQLICERGDNHGVGFDPSYTPIPGKKIHSERVEFIADYYSDRYAWLPADLIYSRHTLEHIDRPVEFLSSLRRTVDTHLQSVVFLEVPNFNFTRGDIRPWDILYEHCSYYNSDSLSFVCRRSGFEVLQVSAAFEGQFLTIDARSFSTDPPHPSPIPLPPSRETIRSAKAFSQNYRKYFQDWQEKITDIHDRGLKTVIWGAGAKGLSFLTMLNIQGEISYVVDINPGKWGKYMPRTGQEIISPEILRTYRPEAIIIMNPIYQTEIKQTVDIMGLNAQFWCA